MPVKSRFPEEVKTISSSFRIDRRAIAGPQEDGAKNVIVLPGLPADLLPKPALSDPADAASAPESAQEAQERAFAARQAEQAAAVAARQEELDTLQRRIEETRQEIAAMLQQADIDAQNIKEEAKRTGYQEGIADAKQEFQQVLQTEKREFQRSVETLARARDEIHEQIEESVLDLSLYIAEKIIGESLREDESRFLHIVKDTIGQVKDQEDIILRLNRKEYDRFFKDESDDLARLLRDSGVQIKQDMGVESGEFVVESEFGTLRSGIQTQLERMRTALTEGA